MADLAREQDEIERITGLPPSAIRVEWVEGSANQRVSVTITCDSDAQRSAAYKSLSSSVADMDDVVRDVVDVQRQAVRQIDGNKEDYFEIEHMIALPDGRMLGVTVSKHGLYLFARKETSRGTRWVSSKMSTFNFQEPGERDVRDGSLMDCQFGMVSCLTTYRHNGEWHVLLADSGARRFRDLDLSEERVFNGYTPAMIVRSFPSYPTPDRNGELLRAYTMVMHIDGVLYVCFESSKPGRTFTIRRCFGFDDQRDVPLAVPAAEDQPFTPEHRKPSPAKLPRHIQLSRLLNDSSSSSSSSSSSDDEDTSSQFEPQKRPRQSPDGGAGGTRKKKRHDSSRQKRLRSNDDDEEDEEDEEDEAKQRSKGKGKGRAVARQHGGGGAGMAPAVRSGKWINIHEGVQWDLDWSIELPVRAETMTAIDDKHILMTSSDGVLRILDIVTGSVHEVKDEKLPDVDSTIFWHPGLSRWVLATDTRWFSMRRDFTDVQALYAIESDDEGNCLLHPDGRTMLSLGYLGRLLARQMTFPLFYISPRLPPAAATDLVRGMGTLRF